MKRRKMSKKAAAFVARKTRINRKEGYPPRQAVAIAYSQARKEGFRIPKRRGR